MMDVMTKITISADVTGLATAVAGLCKGFEGLSAVDVHRDARRECAREGVCIAAGVAAVGGCERRNEKGMRGGAAYVVGVGAE
jgi:tetrahydromethanopterin S-methyltransferase subunit E